jgi:cytochrome c oxidase subunit I
MLRFQSPPLKPCKRFSRTGFPTSFTGSESMSPWGTSRVSFGDGYHTPPRALATFAGTYFWFPKMTGRLLDERLGKLHFWLTLIGFHTTFLVQHWLGDMGMPRRYADYLPTDGFTTLNVVSTIGAFILGVSTLPFVWNVFCSWRYGEPVTVDDPWGYGNSLEWATSCPPPRHNFNELLRIRSERPAFELHYPWMVERLRAESHVGRHAEISSTST